MAATVPPEPSNSQTENDLTADQVFGEYELIEEVARGGMGVIYKARHRKLNRIAVLKMILSGRFSSDEELQRFHIEAEAAANLDHSGIVPVYEIGEVDGQAFFAMKFIEGGSLAGRGCLAPGCHQEPSLSRRREPDVWRLGQHSRRRACRRRYKTHRG